MQTVVVTVMQCVVKRTAAQMPGRGTSAAGEQRVVPASRPTRLRTERVKGGDDCSSLVGEGSIAE